jgi:beta-glucanase (GH16 family)
MFEAGSPRGGIRFGLVFTVLMLASVFCMQAGPVPAATEAYQPLGRDDPFVMVLNEEFDAPTLNQTLWVTCYWWDNNGCTNLSSKNLNWYRPDNVSIEDGKLVLTARPEKVKGWRGRTFPYTSGMVTSGRYYADPRSATGFEATYGFFEIRAKIPAGQGLWPAFWMLPSSHDSLPEIDIMEVLGHAPTLLELHLHRRDKNGEKRSAAKTVATKDLSNGWHVYGVDWSPDRIVWYLDGQEVWRFSERETIPNEPMYLLINLAVGGSWPGNPDGTTRFPARFEIDYVRAWKRP